MEEDVVSEARKGQGEDFSNAMRATGDKGKGTGSKHEDKYTRRHVYTCLRIYLSTS